MSPVDWIVDQQGSAAPRPDPRRVATVVRVAEAGTSREPGGQAICAAVQAGVLPVRSAAQIARFVRDVKPLADPAVLEQDVAVLCAAASDGPDGRGLPDRELAQAVRYATNLTRADRGLDGDEDRCCQARALWSGPGPAGMTSYRMLLEPEAAAAVESAISGLSAPVKGPDRKPDLRPAARRRADALLEAIRRRAAASTDLPGGTKTQIVVTIPLADLNEQVRGAGLTTTGELLSPATVRRLACDAQLIPMVLGGHTELLDLGHGERYFTPAQRRAVARRDGHCTYPACTVPPPGATSTTCAGGAAAGAPTWTTPLCCANDTTPSSTNTTSMASSTSTASPGTDAPTGQRRPDQWNTLRTRMTAPDRPKDSPRPGRRAPMIAPGRPSRQRRLRCRWAPTS